MSYGRSLRHHLSDTREVVKWRRWQVIPYRKEAQVPVLSLWGVFLDAAGYIDI